MCVCVCVRACVRVYVCEGVCVCVREEGWEEREWSGCPWAVFDGLVGHFFNLKGLFTCWCVSPAGLSLSALLGVAS